MQRLGGWGAQRDCFCCYSLLLFVFVLFFGELLSLLNIINLCDHDIFLIGGCLERRTSTNEAMVGERERERERESSERLLLLLFSSSFCFCSFFWRIIVTSQYYKFIWSCHFPHWWMLVLGNEKLALCGGYYHGASFKKRMWNILGRLFRVKLRNS